MGGGVGALRCVVVIGAVALACSEPPEPVATPTAHEDEAPVAEIGTLGGNVALQGPGAGFGNRWPRVPAPRVRAGVAEVEGALSREIVQRVTLRSVGQLRSC